MLLVIHNLPSYMRYTDVKSLIFTKCGVSELILDNLTNEGTRKKVTVGLADEGDGAIIVRKINGLFLDGNQLYVENPRSKKEQPYRPSQELVAEMSLKPMPEFQQLSKYAPEENAVQMNAKSMMYYNMPMTGMYDNEPLATAAPNSFMGFDQQTPVSKYEYPTHSLDYLPNENAADNGRDVDYQSFNIESKSSSQKWGNKNSPNKRWDANIESQSSSQIWGNKNSPNKRWEANIESKSYSQIWGTEESPNKRWDANIESKSSSQIWGNKNSSNKRWDANIESKSSSQIWGNKNSPNKRWDANIESKSSSQIWGNEKSPNKQWDARQPYFAQSLQADYKTPDQSSQVVERPDYRSESIASPQRYRSPPGDGFQRRDRNDRNILFLFENNELGERFDPNPNSFDIGPQRSEPDRSSQDWFNQKPHSPIERRLGIGKIRPADRITDNRWDESQPKRMAAYQDVNYPQNDFYEKDFRETLWNSRNDDKYSIRDKKPAYQNNLNQGRDAGPIWRQGPEQVKPNLCGHVPPLYQGASSAPTVIYGGFQRELTQIQTSEPFRKQRCTFKNKQWLNPNKFAATLSEKTYVKKQPTRKMLVRNKKMRKITARQIAEEVVKNCEVERFQKQDKIFLMLQLCVRARLDVLLGDRLDVTLANMHRLFREKYPQEDDPAFFFHVVEQAKKEAVPIITGTQDAGNLKSATNMPAPKPPLPKVEKMPLPKVEKMPLPKVEKMPLAKVEKMPLAKVEKMPLAKVEEMPLPKDEKMPLPKVEKMPLAKDKTGPLSSKPGPSIKPQLMTPSSNRKIVTKAEKKITKEMYENPDMFKLKPHLQEIVNEQLDTIYDLFMGVVQNPDNDEEKEICEMIANKGANEAKNVLRVNLSKRLLNFTAGLVVTIFGNVRKEPLEAFLKRYGGCNVRQTKYSKKKNIRSYIATVRSFQKYDVLCALKTAVVDGVQINIKPLNVAGPPSKPKKQEIERNRKDFILNQINLKESYLSNIPTISKQKVEYNDELDTRSSCSSIGKVGLKNKVKINLLKDNLVKKEVKVENKEEIKDAATTTAVHTDLTISDDTAQAIKIDDEASYDDIVETINIDEESTSYDTPQATNIAEKLNANVTLEHYNKLQVKNSNNQGSKIHNDAGLNDLTNDATDMSNDEIGQVLDDFDVDDIDLDENDLEDY